VGGQEKPPNTPTDTRGEITCALPEITYGGACLEIIEKCGALNPSNGAGLRGFPQVFPQEIHR